MNLSDLVGNMGRHLKNDNLNATNVVCDYDGKEEYGEVLEPPTDGEDLLKSHCLVVQQSLVFK
ncbi:hypothetical protein J1N35_034607 [Gossypium stocksii]|uniref:Uncharacterized protein n=1 Tax=Gossypium stocksii TaxID=47602 RepID=A0A9D3ZQP8_9ROSI|nr:hypothetical protein J1N35_034607 [Gossypium stocksii]